MKNIRNIILVGTLVLASLILIGCDGARLADVQAESIVTPEPDEPAGLANPASVYCEEQGGTLEIRTDADGGQYGVCVFDDGRECEEWAFFRGECEKSDSVEVETAVPTPPLTDTIWHLQAYTQPLLPDSDITVTFTDAGELHGTAGCNSYFGSYMIEEDTLTIGAIGSTQMWCEDMMEQETAFLELLQNAVQYELSASTLTIHAKGGDLIFGLDEPAG